MTVVKERANYTQMPTDVVMRLHKTIASIGQRDSPGVGINEETNETISTLSREERSKSSGISVIIIMIVAIKSLIDLIDFQSTELVF